jgi:Condensation domain/AMP-binding enzyme
VATFGVEAISADFGTATLQSLEGEVQYPASLGQQRFWVLDRLDPGNPSLNVAVRWQLEGELSASLIEKAFQLILARHEALRTFFVEADGEPIQVVQPSAPLHVPSIDLTALPEADALADCDRIAQTEARTPFNLSIAPLIRVMHVRVRSDVAILLVTTHHAVCDGWSIGILAEEMGEICAALQSGRTPMVPELPVTYGEYSCWQRQFIADGRLADDIEFWSQALDGMGYFELPSDFPHKAGQPPVSYIRAVLLDRTLTDNLAAVGRRHSCTMFMTALAGLLTLLHRYTGALDIALGTQVAGRSHVEVERLVGLFINTLVVRTQLADDPRFAELLARVRGVVADAFEHESMPLEKVIEALKPKRHPGHNAVFSVNFIFQRSFIKNADHGKFRLVDLPSYSAGAMYDLNFFMVERPEGWRVSCEYATNLYEEKTIDRLLRHFVNILEAVAVDPSRTLSEIPILDEAERFYLLFDCNQTAASYPRHLSLPQLFDQQAARTPAASAVVDGGQTLSYAEVACRSNALAVELLRRGIGRGARVGVFVERSADLVIVPLAIMKA